MLDHYAPSRLLIAPPYYTAIESNWKGSRAMTKEPMAVGLALVAVLAMSAVAASGAQAGTFESAGYPTTISGAQVTKHEITTNAGTLKCNVATFAGSATEASSELTLAPTYSGCTIAGFGAAVNMNGCDYLLTALGSSGSGVAIEIHIVCPGGKKIEITVVGTTCKISIDSQSRAGIVGTNNAGAIDTTINVSGIAYEIANGAGNKCPNKPMDGAYNSGTYKGSASFGGSNGAISITP
jgi:hypothetical protein